MSSTAHRVVAIIQARMGSTRLSGKVLMDLEGAPVLARVVKRVQRARTIDEIVVATTRMPADDAIADECRRLNTDVFRGEENDVLDRYYHAAQFSHAEVVVRITSDCPLIDPEIVNLTVEAFLDEQPDYASNTLTRSYPRGLDTEVFSMAALQIAWREAAEPYQREHVTPFIFENPKRFTLVGITSQTDHSELRWTVDTEPDLEFVRAVYSRFEGHDDFGWREVLAVLDRDPHLSTINQHISQKALRGG